MSEVLMIFLTYAGMALVAFLGLTVFIIAISAVLFGLDNKDQSGKDLL